MEPPLQSYNLHNCAPAGLNRGYLAIEKKNPDPGEFAAENNVLPDTGAFEKSFSGAENSLLENRRLSEPLSVYIEQRTLIGKQGLDTSERVLLQSHKT